MRPPRLRHPWTGRIDAGSRGRRRRTWLRSSTAALAIATLLLPLEGGSPIALGPSRLASGDAPLTSLAGPGALAARQAPGEAGGAGNARAGGVLGGPAGHLPTGDTVPADPGATASVAPEALRGYAWPLRNARITTWYAPTDGGFVVVDGRRVHDGIDLATFCGDTVRAAHDGRVLYVGRYFEPYVGFDDPLDGYYATLKAKGLPSTVQPLVVVVDDGNGYRSLYVHLASATAHVGAVVRGGQALGREGMTGHASGCHLHYGLVRMDGIYVPVAAELVAKWHYPAWIRTRIDPLLVLDPFAHGAARELPGLPPPAASPGGPGHAAILAMWRARQPPPALPADQAVETVPALVRR